MSMPHHGEEYETQSELLKRFQEERAGKAQREFPQGRISGDDDGSITFKVGCDPDKNVVAIEYAKPVTWVAMSPKDAVEFAQMLIKHARSISKEPLRVVLN